MDIVAIAAKIVLVGYFGRGKAQISEEGAAPRPSWLRAWSAA